MSTQINGTSVPKFTDSLRNPLGSPPKKPKKSPNRAVQIVTIDHWNGHTVVMIQRGTYNVFTPRTYNNPTQASLSRLSKVLNRLEWKSTVWPNHYSLSVFYFSPREVKPNV